MKLKIYITSALFALVAFIFSGFNQLSAQQIQPGALRQMQSLLDEKESRTPAQKKMDSQLWYAIKMGRGQAITSEVATLEVNVNKDASGMVTVDINGRIDDALVQAIISAGGKIVFSSPAFNVVTARLPLPAVEQIASLNEVKQIITALPPSHAGSPIAAINKKTETAHFIGEAPFRKPSVEEIQKFRPGFEQRAERVRRQVIKALAGMEYKTEDWIGAATSQGDVKHNAAIARTTFSVNGSGIKIGILSDSYNALGAAAANVTAGDLPGVGNPNGFTTPVTVLSDITGASDEGRAMLQIVHDIAPGAQLYFASAFISEANFAQSILDLRTAGCDIICDDVFYFDEPPFQDGIVAQAVNTVTAAGALYFSSAGNQGNKNDNTASVWEGDFADGGTLALLPGGNLHIFSGATNNNALTSSANRLFLFWSDPQSGSSNDYDLFVLDAGLTTILASSTSVQSGTQVPMESITSTRAAGQRIVILKKTAAAARALHMNIFGSGMTFTTQGQTHGHSSAAAAFSVAATQASGAGPFTGSAVVETFSSDGPRRKFYDPSGTAITPGNFLFSTSGGTLLQKPDITGADGVATTLPGGSGLNPFFGTSAAAPHAAAIAGLLKSYRPGLTPAQIRTALTSTAIDIETPGTDRDAGFGIVMALEALTSVSGPSVTINQAGAQADPTATSPINFTVVFSSAVTGFATGDVVLGGTAGATTGTVTGSGTTYNVAVSGMTGGGTVIATIPANVCIDGSSNGNAASTSTDNTVTFIVPPTVTINQAAAQADPTAASPINFTVVFSLPVTGFTAAGVVLSGTAGATTKVVTGSGSTYNVAVSGMTGGGTVIATVPAGVADAGLGNLNLASTSTDNTVTYLNTPPTVTINQAAAQADPTGSSPINFTVVFNETVTGFTTGDVTLSGTAGATTATVTGSGTTYNVAVTGMTASGTVIATIAANVAVDIDANGNLASTSTDNTVTFSLCTLTCPANIVVSNTAGQCGAIVTFTPTATVGCGTVTATPASGSFFPIGTTTVNVTTTAGASCSFTVRVNDTQAPVITCPANIIVSNTTGQCGAVVTFPFPTVVDNCPFGATTPRSITQSSSNTITPGSVGCNAGGLHTDNSYWRAYDLGPLALPGAFTINTVTFGIETANAAGTGTTQPVTVRLYTSAGAFPGGTRTLVGSQTYNIPDQTNSLFTATLTTPVTVPATAILVLEIFTPDGQTAGHSFFIGSNTAAQTGPSYISAAACGAANPTDLAALGFPNMHIVLNAAGTVPVPGSGIVMTPASGSLFPVGTTTVTSTATDAAGNTASCTFTVRVNDTQAPAITCPGNITVSTPVGLCTAVVPYTVTATDNCPGVTTALFSGLASNATYPIGVTTNTWRATDAAGNVSNCTFTVTVLDGQLPVISVQPANRTVCSGTTGTFSVTATNVTAYQWQLWNGTAWNNITGATAASYTTPTTTTAMNDGSYRVVLTGLCSSVTSGFATLFVNPLPIVSLAASGSPVLLPTQNTSLLPTVSPTGGTFAWFKNGAAYTGTTTGLKVEDVGTYRFVYTDPNGCVSTSNDVVVSAQVSGGLYIYPNPNVGLFYIRFYNNPNEKVTVSVYNSAGQKVLSQSSSTLLAYSQITVDLGARSSGGIYLVKVFGSDGRLIGEKRIIVGKR